MAKKLLIGTDVFVDYLMGEPHAKEFFEQLPEGTFYYSPLTRFELLSASVCADQAVRNSTNALLSLGKKIELDDSLVNSAAELGRQHSLSVTDAAIVAAAIYLKAELVTKKVGELKKIANLLLMKPY
ncbi:MAG TPA: PIN domain-containing protein [Candidatus Nanoarchaeia archaeon]|nr:PIN domain-containing protein [Candidatus Nanoarchaeia archaeon]